MNIDPIKSQVQSFFSEAEPHKALAELTELNQFVEKLIDLLKDRLGVGP